MQTETITAGNVEALKKAAEAAHASYSEAFEQAHEAELDLGAAAAVRSALVQALDANRRLLFDLRRAAIEAAIGGREGFKMAAACVLAGASEVSLLETALQKFHAFEYQDALRESLIAKVKMYDAQHFSEKARLAHRIGEIEIGLASLAARSGGLEVQLGGAIGGHTELIARIQREADGARAELAAANEEARGLRELYQQGELK